MFQRIILLILFPLFGFSQAPQKINFQSILRNSSGEVVANQSVSLKISILSGSIGGSAAYSETHTKTTDPSGLISLQIGNGTVLSGVFANIAWGDFPHFIKLEADFSGGNNYVLLGTQELMSVPYALYASKTDTSSLNLVNRFSYLQNQVELLSSYTSLLASGLVDIDRNNYPVVKIGNQIWMKENLRVSRYRNGDIIPIVSDNGVWNSLRTIARCWYVNDSTTNEITYGNLYNWYAVVDSRNICPIGFHVPSDSEWNKLVKSLDSGSDTTGTATVQSTTAGGKLKSVGTAYWNSPNTGATNESGFSALPGGIRFEGGGFFGIRDIAIFWSKTEIDNYYAESRSISYNRLLRSDPTSNDKSVGASVRCLKD